LTRDHFVHEHVVVDLTTRESRSAKVRHAGMAPTESSEVGIRARSDFGS
jgi:hypothetical protein